MIENIQALLQQRISESDRQLRLFIDFMVATCSVCHVILKRIHNVSTRSMMMTDKSDFDNW